MNNKSSGIGIFGILGIVFIILKLINVITWSWWWVLLPIYGPIVLLTIVIILTIVTLFVYNLNK